MKSGDDLNESITEQVGVHIGEHEDDSVELVYTFLLADESSRAYFIPLNNWNIVDVIMTD